MSRWKPDARGRLERAALELYNDQGFDATTVADIAARAGLTERTFYRHFTDKREVLFPGGNPLAEVLARAAGDLPVTRPPLEVITHTLTQVAPMLEERADQARQRQAVIAANRELQERELAKLAALATTLADVLRGRGVEPITASLAADLGISAFRIAFERWVSAPDPHALAWYVRETLEAVQHLVTPTEPAEPTAEPAEPTATGDEATDASATVG